MARRSSRSVQHSSLRGRGDECALLDGFARAVRRGESRALVLRGEAGIGKTALLEYLIASASELTVLRTVGVESEMELAYAGLHQLCAPLLDRLGRLPGPQQQALEIVFGLSTGAAPDRFLVGLGLLSLLSEAADDGPLLCVVDDAQWLDQASALTLAFVARRLLAEPVGILFAAREPGEELRHFSELEVLGLRNGDARALLGSAVGFVLDARVRDRIIAEMRGNPLALIELPRGLSATQLAGGFGLLGAAALTGRIEESFVARLKELPEDARVLLLVAAADPVGDPLLLWRAAERLGISRAAAEGPEANGLLAIGERVTFRHPLVRSAMYRSAAPGERRAAHLALAEATDREADPDRRAWHLAAAAPGPDEEVASELERSAGRAQARGGLAAAAAFLQRAVELTPEPAQRSERALAAAQVTVQAGAFDAALGLLRTAEAGALDEFQRARIDLLRGQVAFATSFGSDAASLLLAAAKRFESLDLDLARETYLEAWGAAVFAGRLASGGSVVDVMRAARATPRRADPPRPPDLLLDGLSLLMTEGQTAAGPTLEATVDAFAHDTISTEAWLRWGWMATAAAIAMWDFDGWLAIVRRGVQLARDTGALAVLPILLQSQCQCAAWEGEFRTATSLIAEADAVAEATESHFAPYAALVLGALRGREAEVSGLIASTMKSAAAEGQGTGVQFAQWVAGILYNGLGRYDEALAAAQQASDVITEPMATWALPELIEAATRTGQMARAVEALQRLVAVTSASDSDWGLGIQARTRALVSEGEDAERSYKEAIERLGRTRLRPELARAHLLYGEWLRREGRRVDARAQLRTAYERFTAIGMEAFAERARKELLATGETVRRRSEEVRDELTVQERHVAQLARDGLSNLEIGARLFISPRTVKYHLQKVFTKLDIKSRSELHRVLPSESPAR
jgi:DNA-binding CsgD family transcriptional regulator/tetratricopeptide (TPR) repeat protein